MSKKPGDLIVKDPSSVEPQGFDWTAYLAELGDSVGIAVSEWSLKGPDAGLVLESDAILAGSLKTLIYLSDGVVGSRYVVTNRIITNTAPPVTDDRSFRVLVQNR